MKDRRLSYTDSDWLLDQGTPAVTPSVQEWSWVAGFSASTLFDAMDRLKERHRLSYDVLTERFWERLTYQQIADRHNLRGRQYALYEVKKAIRLMREELNREDV